MRYLFIAILALAGLPVFSQNPVLPGDKQGVRFRCAASIISSEPLYVVDGEIWDRSSLSEFDPASIESINILKSPVATALWGSRAANGVIYIQLKKTPVARLRIYSSFDSALGDVELVVTRRRVSSEPIQLYTDANGFVDTGMLKNHQTYRVTAEHEGYESLSFEWTPKPGRDTIVKMMPVFKELQNVVVSASMKWVKCSFGYCGGVVRNCQVHMVSSPLSDSINLLVRAYPNPVRSGSSVNLELPDVARAEWQLQLFNISGAMLFSKTMKAIYGKSQVSVPIPAGLSGGSYFIKASNQFGQRMSSKILVQ